LIDDSIFIINDDFYQKNYLNFINKKCRPEEQMKDLLEKKDYMSCPACTECPPCSCPVENQIGSQTGRLN